jgi:hypothetical protein
VPPTEEQIRLVTKGRFDSGFQGLDALIQPLDAVAELFGKISPLLMAAEGLITAFKLAVQIVLGPILFFMGLVADATGFMRTAAQQIKTKLAEFLAAVDFDMAQAAYRGPVAQFPNAVTAYFTPYNSQTSADANIHAHPAETDVTAVIIVTTDKVAAVALSPDNFCVPIVRPQNSPTLQAVAGPQAAFVAAPATSATLYAAYAIAYKPGTSDEIETPASPAARVVVKAGEAVRITLPESELTLPGAPPRSRYVYLGTSEITMRRVGALTGSDAMLTVQTLPPTTAQLPVGATGEPPAAQNKITNAQIAADAALGVTWKSAASASKTYRLALLKKRAEPRPAGPTSPVSVAPAGLGEQFKANETYEFSYSYMGLIADPARPEQPPRELETAVAPWQKFTTTDATSGLTVTVPAVSAFITLVYMRHPDRPDTMYRVQTLMAGNDTVTWAPTGPLTWAHMQTAWPVDPNWDRFEQKFVTEAGEVHAFAFPQAGVLKGEYRVAVASEDSEMLSHNVPYEGAKFFETRTKETVLVDFQSESVVDVQFKTNWLPDATVDPYVKVSLKDPADGALYENSLSYADQEFSRSSDGLITHRCTLPDGASFAAGAKYKLVLELLQQGQAQDSVLIEGIVYTPDFFTDRTPQALTVQFTSSTQASVTGRVGAAWASVPNGTSIKFKFEVRSTVPAGTMFTAQAPWTGGAVSPSTGTTAVTQQVLLTTPHLFAQGSTYEFVITPVVNGEELVAQRLEAAKTYGTAAALAPSMGPLWVLPFLKVFYILNPVKDFLGQVDSVLERAFSVLKETVDKASERKAGIEAMLKFFDDLLENVRSASNSVQGAVTRLFSFKASFKAALKLGPVCILKYDGKVGNLGAALAANDQFATLVDLGADTEIYATIYIAQGSGRAFVSSLLGG